MIDIQGLSIERGGLPVLRDISLSIPSGGLVAIIGPNGAGKSTLLHCMAGLLKPDTGRIRIDGHDIHNLSEGERALMLSLLTQSQGAVPRLSVQDLVRFGRWPHHRGRPGAEDQRIVDDAMERFALHDFAEKDVETLSGGQRQRAFVAMCYAQTTPWMLLDEPLSALDPKFSRDIMDRILGVTSAPGATRSVALVLHDLQVASRYATWVVCLKDGRVLKAGPREETLSSDLLSELYDTPLRLSTLEDMPVVIPG